MLNAFPAKTMPKDDIQAFEQAICMLSEQTTSEENKFEETQVLLIDSINQIPDDLFNVVVSNFKYLTHDHRELKVIILVSGCN